MPANKTKAAAERQEIDPVFKDVLTFNFRQLDVPIQTQVEVSRLPRTMDALVILKQSNELEKVRLETAFSYFRVHNQVEFKGKGDSLTRAVRVPIFVTWPGYVPARTTYHVVALYDFFATACELAGSENPPETDGISFVPLLEGCEEKQISHEFLYWENGGHAPHAQAVRMDKWFAWREHPNQPIQLWDTEMDVESEHDVSADHPGVVQRVQEFFETEHVDSEWFLNPGETDEEFKAKSQQAEREGCLQNPVTANTEYRGQSDDMAF